MDRYPFDADYLRRLREGDPATVDHFVKYFKERLTLKLYKFAKSDRDDIIQDTFARFFEKLQVPDGIKSPESLGAFVTSICHHVVLEWYRIKGRQPTPFDNDNPVDIPASDPNIEQLLMQGEEDEVVRRTLKQLKPQEREIILDIFVRKVPKDELCAKHHCSKDYLRVVLHRAVVRFRLLYLNEKGKPPERGN